MGDPVNASFCIEQLQLLLVDFFPESFTRTRLMRDLRFLVAELEGAGLKAALHVGGEFVRDDPNPTSIDLVICVPEDSYQVYSPHQLAVLNGMCATDTSRKGRSCRCQLRIIAGGGRAETNSSKFVIHIEPEHLHTIRLHGEENACSES